MHYKLLKRKYCMQGAMKLSRMIIDNIGTFFPYIFNKKIAHKELGNLINIF